MVFSPQEILFGFQSRKMRLVGNVAVCVREDIAYKVLVFKSEVKRLLGRSRNRWEDNIEANLK